MNDKTKKAALKMHMSPESVAAIAVKAMFAGKREVITGFINKLGAFLVWLLPKNLVESTAASIYK
jgi:short-subunit dehydrogenase